MRTWLIDPIKTLMITNTTKKINCTRSEYTATLLPNGKVLVVGGYTSDSRSLSSAELYDPASGHWQK